jgi:hypothetical protein
MCGATRFAHRTATVEHMSSHRLRGLQGSISTERNPIEVTSRSHQSDHAHRREVSRSGRRGIRTPCDSPRVSRGRERSGAESGTRVARCDRRGGRAAAARGAGRPSWGSGGLGAAEGTRGDVAAHGRGRAARGWRAARGRGHGSSLAQAHALGPTEELAGAIEFVSGGCHRCHRYPNKHGAETTMRLCVGFVDHPNNMHETTVITCEIVAEDIGEI